MHFVLKLGLVLFAGILAAPLSAQTATNSATFGDWIVRCEATATGESCRLIQTMTRTDDQSLVARFITFPGRNGEAFFVAQVPIGAYLPATPVIRLMDPNDNQPRPLVWQRCLGEICEAATAIAPGELAKYKSVGKILFGYKKEQNEDPIVVQVDVTRLEEALAAAAAAK